jgi:hypothetical protein
MTSTLANLVDEVLLNLNGYTMRQDRTTHLTADINSSALVLNLGSVTNIGKGVVEIDDELIWIDTYDRVSSSATAAPYGRGYQGSSAASHTTNTKVTISPTFPKISIKRAINDTIRAVFPQLYGVDRTTFSLTATQSTYSLPAAVDTVLGVSWDTPGPTGEWMPVKQWRHDPMANATAYVSGQTISVYDRITPGRTVQVTYSKEPTVLSNSNDVFETVTGLPSSAKDVIVYGASYRLASFIDPGRLTFTSAEADQADTKIQFGSGSNAARFMLALYQQRLTEEAGKLRDQFPVRIHYTRY